MRVKLKDIEDLREAKLQTSLRELHDDHPAINISNIGAMEMNKWPSLPASATAFIAPCLLQCGRCALSSPLGVFLTTNSNPFGIAHLVPVPLLTRHTIFYQSSRKASYATTNNLALPRERSLGMTCAS